MDHINFFWRDQFEVTPEPSVPSRPRAKEREAYKGPDALPTETTLESISDDPRDNKKSKVKKGDKKK